MENNILKLSPKIKKAIDNANKILLHCHPYPDPDSIGANISMVLALKSLGKDVVSIIGDTKYPEELLGLPSNNLIIDNSYNDINPEDYDLFIILDSSNPSQITQKNVVEFPEGMTTIIIDHHKTNTKYADINLVEPEYAATCQVLSDLFKSWSIEITKDMAICLFIGIFADTGGFKYTNTTPEVIETALELVKINPKYHQIIFEMENNKKPIEIEMRGLAFASLEKYCSDSVVLSLISYDEIQERTLNRSEAMEGLVASTLRAVKGWDIVASLVEADKNVTTVSIRTRDDQKYDVSLIAKSVGKNGGGHRGAAGTTIYKPLNEAKEELIEKIKQTFHLI